MLINILIKLREDHTKEQFQEIIETTMQDIKFNRIAFNKTTGEKKFIEILDISKNVVMRTYKTSLEQQ